MDHLIYTAMSGAGAAANRQAILASNLANISTNGFRAQLETYRAVPLNGEGASRQSQVRAYQRDGAGVPDVGVARRIRDRTGRDGETQTDGCDGPGIPDIGVRGGVRQSSRHGEREARSDSDGRRHRRDRG